MAETVIEVRGLGKEYRLGQRSAYTTLRESLSGAARRQFARVRGRPAIPVETRFWALRDVSFDVSEGEIVGIIGRNGAGKSTLLKVLSRITEPTEGRVLVRGRISSLLEVGTGFHPELTGRENVFLNGAILGLTRREIRRKFHDIVDFADIGPFLDTPVKRYSSGMYVRLAFSVAAHLESEVLIVDEVLAVGDAEFQKKCLGRMQDVSRSGRTVLFVSHNMPAIQRLCTRGILVDQGRVAADGSATEVVRRYLDAADTNRTSATALADRTDRSGNGKVRFKSFHLEDAKGARIGSLQSGTSAHLVFGFETANALLVQSVDVGFSFATGSGDMLTVFYASYANQTFSNVPRSGYFRCLIERFPLAAGEYTLGARIEVAGEEADWLHDGVATVLVEPGDFYRTGKTGFGRAAPLLMDGRWFVTAREGEAPDVTAA